MTSTASKSHFPLMGPNHRGSADERVGLKTHLLKKNQLCEVQTIDILVRRSPSPHRAGAALQDGRVRWEGAGSGGESAFGYI